MKLRKQIKNILIDGTQKYKVFYNRDCAKWGVLRYGNLMNDCMGNRWQQVCLKEKPAYTKYRG